MRVKSDTLFESQIKVFVLLKLETAMVPQPPRPKYATHPYMLVSVRVSKPRTLRHHCAQWVIKVIIEGCYINSLITLLVLQSALTDIPDEYGSREYSPFTI